MLDGAVKMAEESVLEDRGNADVVSRAVSFSLLLFSSLVKLLWEANTLLSGFDVDDELTMFAGELEEVEL